MAFTSADIPARIDVLINGEGFRFLETATDGKAEYAFTPPFVPRQNTQGDYGDNQQDFWLSLAQRDWSLGEQQRFFRPNDQVGSRRYWRGAAVDVRVPGEVTLRPAVKTLTLAGTPTAAGVRMFGNTQRFMYTTSTNLYDIDASGAATDNGAHGLGGSPATICADGSGSVYLSRNSSAGVGVRRWTGAAFSTFSATGADDLIYLNNTLYGMSSDAADCKLRRYDTAGTATVLHTFQGAAGTVYTLAAEMVAYGNKLMILLYNDFGTELYQYDGTGVTLVARLPGSFVGRSMCESMGVLYIGGSFHKIDNGNMSNYLHRPAVFYYVGGSIGLLWQADDYGTTQYTGPRSGPAAFVASHDGGVVWPDETTGRFLYYNVATGGVSGIGEYTVTGTSEQIVGAHLFFVQRRSGTTAYMFPDTTTRATSGYVTSSLFDFDSSLDKVFRGIKVEFDAGVGGNLGSVDIAYRVGDTDGSYTTLQSSAASGTEYTLSNITGRSISVKVTINKGTSTTPPKLKRVSVRAVPKQSAFRREQYVLDLSGRNGSGHLELRDDSLHPKDGLEQATLLRTAMTSSNPITVVDRFGSFTGVIESDKSRIVEVRPEEFYAVIAVREV